MWGSPAERLVSLEGSKLQEMNRLTRVTENTKHSETAVEVPEGDI